MQDRVCRNVEKLVGGELRKLIEDAELFKMVDDEMQMRQDTYDSYPNKNYCAKCKWFSTRDGCRVDSECPFSI